MIACYDLAHNPPTYDVVAFLALADLERSRRGEDSIDIHVLPGPVGGFRGDGLWPHSVEERIRLREDVLVPLCRMLPTAKSVAVRSDREVDGWGKKERHISLPAIVKALRGRSRPLSAQPSPGDYVTFTLREAAHHPLRNSRTPEWARAAQEVEQNSGTRVIVIRDTMRADKPLLGTTIYPEASRGLRCRAELYAGARLNVGICNGPMWMAIFMDAPVLMLRPTTNAARNCYDDQFYAAHGIPRGSQLPSSPRHQRLAWEEDYREDIVRETTRMLREME